MQLCHKQIAVQYVYTFVKLRLSDMNLLTFQPIVKIFNQEELG